MMKIIIMMMTEREERRERVKRVEEKKRKTSLSLKGKRGKRMCSGCIRPDNERRRDQSTSREKQ